MRSATSSGDNAKIADPFLYLNIACPPGSYDANVEPAKDDVLFANSELLLGIIERWFHSIYGKVQPSSSKPSAKTVSASKPHGIEMLLARKDTPVESAPVGLSPLAGSTLPNPRSASELTAQTQPRSSPLATPAFYASASAPPSSRQSNEITGAISLSLNKPPATDKTQAEAPPGLLLRHDVSTSISPEEPSLKPSSDAVPSRRKPVWNGSMYAEEEDEEEDLELHLQGRPRLPVDLDLDGDEHLRDVNVSNPWAFAKLNAAMRPSGRKKQLHTPGRQDGDVGRSTDPSSDDLPRHVESSLLKKPSPCFDQARSSPEAAYPTPSPFPFPQKARGKRRADDASLEALETPAPSNRERYKRGALDTWVQKSLCGYDELNDFPDAFQEDQGPPDLPYPRDFVSARSLPPGGTPLSEIPDASQRPRRNPAPRKQQRGNIDKPFISPVNDPSRVWFDIGGTFSQKRHQKPSPNKDHQDKAAAPTLILPDDEIEDDESVTSASAQRSLPPMHPDLAITLDYEARKQKAVEAHKKVLREQAAAARLARKALADAPNPLHPQHATTSPHKNRQAKAIAALHTPDSPSTAAPSLGVEEISAFEPSDPRAYLLRIHQQGEQAPGSLRGKSRRQKTSMLPLENVKEENFIGDLTLVVDDVNVGDVEEDMQESGVWDNYVKRGEEGDAFGSVGAVSAEEIKSWDKKLRDLLRGMYAEEGEGESVDLDVDLSKILQAHAAGFA